MKRIYAAAVLLILMAVFTVAATLYMQVFTLSALQLLENADNAYANRDFALCAQNLADLDALCEEKQPFLEIFVRKEITQDLQKNIKGLPAYNQADSPQEYTYAAQALKTDLVFLRRSFFSVL